MAKCKKGYKLNNGKCSKKQGISGISINSKSGGGGVGFLGLLTLLFIGLKLTGYISWSWWWVLSPLWIPAILGVIILIIFMIIFWSKK